MSRPVDGSDVSAIIASYNDAQRLPDALASIAAQTVRPREVVIADDGSIDDTLEVVETFGRAHPELPIVFLPSSVNTGNPATRNRAIEAATGGWLAICDDDDVWLPERLERQLDLLADWTSPRPVVAVSAWGINTNDRLDHVSPAHMGPVGEAAYDAIVASGGLFYCLHSSLLLDREQVLDVGGYRTEYDGVEDLDLLARLAGRGVIACVDEELVLYRKRLGSIQAERNRLQDLATDRLVRNERRRREGLGELSAAEHEALLEAQPWRRRLRWRARSTGKRHYRRGSVLAVNGHRVRGVAHLVVAAVLDPARVLAGVGAVRSRRRRRRTPMPG